MRQAAQWQAIQWCGHLRLLDQRCLPDQINYLELYSSDAVADAIASMVVRGAPAIGITAAYGVVLAAQQHAGLEIQAWLNAVHHAIHTLQASRPTAVNLFWALDQMHANIHRGRSVAENVQQLTQAAQAIHTHDVQINRRMAAFGADVIGQVPAVLTHCNTGALATGGHGTALGVIRTAYQQQQIQQVYADETRPWLQGARLTAWELAQDHIPVTLLCEGAVASLLQQGKVQWIIVGADRIAANGDTANKIGTFSLAVMARHFGVRFMVVAPTSTLDLQTAKGQDIPVELRAGDEILSGPLAQQASVSIWNPAFDITPAEFIDVLVTEQGVVHQPNREKLMQLTPLPINKPG